MKTLERLINTAVFFLQILVIGLILAFLRHHYRWVYYPFKWFTTFFLSFVFSILGFVVFKLVFGVSEQWFSQLMYDIGTSTNLQAAGFWFVFWLVLVGSFVTTLIDSAVSQIEKYAICENKIVQDERGRLSEVIDHPWTPTIWQSFLWNAYGLVVFVFVTFKLLTHQGTSLLGIWE